EPGETGHGGGEEQGVVAQVVKPQRAENAAEGETDEEHAVESEATPVDRLAPEPMAAGDAQIRHNAGEVCRANDRAAVTRGHRVLQAAGHGSEVVAREGTAPKEVDRRKEQGRLEREHDAIAPAEPQRTLP